MTTPGRSTVTETVEVTAGAAEAVARVATITPTKLNALGARAGAAAMLGV
jgi:hypothetical protein